MSKHDNLPNPTQVVIGSCADAIANVGVMAFHTQQAAANAETNPEAAALHKRAAVQRAKVVRQLLMTAFAPIDGFIAALDEDKPRIARI